MTEHAQLHGQADRMAVADLTPFGGNPRRGRVDVIAESLAASGQYRPIVVNLGAHTGRRHEVLAGNHTLAAAKHLGWAEVDVWLVDVDDAAAKRIVAADNRTADLGDYDEHALLDLLASLDDLEGTGYSEDDLAELEDLLRNPEPPLTDPDDVPPVPADPVSKPGQVWFLGDHRLLVGDSTEKDAVLGLFGDHRADCVWTDPPYGVEYVGKTKSALRIQNDSVADLPGLIEAMTSTSIAVSRPGAAMYVSAPPGPQFADFAIGLQAGGMQWRQTLMWVKNTMVLGRSDYHYKHEPIFYGFAPGGKGRLGRGGARWGGNNAQDSVFAVDRPTRNADHPTMKPVELVAAMLTNSCPSRGIVFDPFGGSGTTLIAAHGLGALAFLVELDPRYADVILRRFEEHTGIVPTLDGDPVSFAGAA